MHPFRFGVQLSRTATASGWRETARRVEALGYSTLFVPDHFEDQFGPLVALAVAAEATTTLRVGSLVFGNDYRHPVVLAKELATLDFLSGGRVECGIGAGWMTADYAQSGIALDPPGTRISRLTESLAVLKALWADGVATLDGSHYQITGATGSPEPVQRPHPPIIVGGGGRRVLGIAAREADIVGVNPNLSAGFIGAETLESAAGEFYDERLTWIKEAAGPRFAQLELQCLTFLVQIVADRDEALTQLAGALSVTPEQIDGSPLALIGSVDQIVDRLRERRERFGLTYIVVHEPEMEAFAPVVAALAGTTS